VIECITTVKSSIKMSSANYYGNGAFEFVQNTSSRALYKNMHGAITQTELWDWMRRFEPEQNKGFMFSEAPELDRIQAKMAEDPISGNHSGASYGSMMRTMQYIAKNGYDNYKQAYLAAN
jgi:hypothetical protein